MILLWQLGLLIIVLCVGFTFILSRLHLLREEHQTRVHQLEITLLEQYHQQQGYIQGQQFNTLKALQDTLREGLRDTHSEVTKLTEQTQAQLQALKDQVEQRLTTGFAQTTTTFHDIVKRLALIDKAQEEITKLSSNVVSLQAILSDKRSRGAFGEVQLQNLITNMLPEQHVVWQATLSTGVRADCLLKMPEPTGSLVIDAKFPLENFQKLAYRDVDPQIQQRARQAFKADIKKHIQDIASKYIVPGETTQGAIMFIPAEAVFAEIHSFFPELVRFAQHKNVWLTSPTTMMAVINTAHSVLKDHATRAHMGILKEHLRLLADDFHRFDERMGKLARHIALAHDDAQKVQTSAQKITKRFTAIDQVELKNLAPSDV